jgi:hypothetical protein
MKPNPRVTATAAIVIVLVAVVVIGLVWYMNRRPTDMSRGQILAAGPVVAGVSAGDMADIPLDMVYNMDMILPQTGPAHAKDILTERISYTVFVDGENQYPYVATRYPWTNGTQYAMMLVDTGSAIYVTNLWTCSAGTHRLGREDPHLKEGKTATTVLEYGSKHVIAFPERMSLEVASKKYTFDAACMWDVDRTEAFAGNRMQRLAGTGIWGLAFYTPEDGYTPWNLQMKHVAMMVNLKDRYFQGFKSTSSYQSITSAMINLKTSHDVRSGYYNPLAVSCTLTVDGTRHVSFEIGGVTDSLLPTVLDTGTSGALLVFDRENYGADLEWVNITNITVTFKTDGKSISSNLVKDVAVESWGLLPTNVGSKLRSSMTLVLGLPTLNVMFHSMLLAWNRQGPGTLWVQ